MAQQVLLAVDNEAEILAALERDLSRRFAADYRIVTAETPEVALGQLNAGDQIAVVIAGQWLTDLTGIEFLSACHQLHPAAKRLLLITYGDFLGGRAAVRAMALGNPEVDLYPTVSGPGHSTDRRCRRKRALRASLPPATYATVQ
jgi:thioredoxin reductase (NADPH)